MTIYVPVYDRGKYECRALDASKCRILKNGDIQHCGTIYSDIAYTAPQGVEHYWAKEYWLANKFKYHFDA